jgi:hypothetical protein
MPAAKDLLAEAAAEIFTECVSEEFIEDKLFLKILPSTILGDVVYQPLDKDIKEIRLLRIHPSSDENSKLECSLSKAHLREGIQFTALSYVWGDPAVTEPITVNGKQMSVTTNLASALHHIRATGVRSIMNRIWIDAICIDQTNILEKSHQVRLMGTLYQMATMVLSWLGPEADGSTAILQLIHRLVSAMQAAEAKGDDSFGWFEEFPEMWDLLENPSCGDVYESLSKLDNRPLFHRGWIFQESFLARSQVFMCGNEALTARQLDGVGLFFDAVGRRHSNPHFIDLKLWAVLRTLVGKQFHFRYVEDWKTKLSTSGNSPTMAHLLIATQNLGVTEPRDKIYSLLGMTIHNIPVDYKKSVASLFSLIPQIWLDITGSLDFLRWTGHRIPEKTGHDLPSWAPDWYAFSKRGIQGFRGDGLASAEVGPKAQIVADAGLLRTSGVLLDVGILSRLGSVGSAESVSTIFRKYIDKERREYPTGIPRLQALFRLLLRSSNISAKLKEVKSDDDLFCNLGAAFLSLLCQDNQQTPMQGLPELGFSNNEDFRTSFQDLFLGANSTVRAPTWSSLHDVDRDGTYQVAMEIAEVRAPENGVFFFATEKGYNGFTTCEFRPDDLVCVVFGSCNPIILRKVDSHYRVVGPCCVLGFMNGEALKGSHNVQVFEIY